MSYTDISRNKRSWENFLYILVCDNNSDLTKMYKGNVLTDNTLYIKSKVNGFVKYLMQIFYLV